MGATTSLPNVRLALVSISTASPPPPPLPSLRGPYCHPRYLSHRDLPFFSSRVSSSPFSSLRISSSAHFTPRLSCITFPARHPLASPLVSSPLHSQTISTRIKPLPYPFAFATRFILLSLLLVSPLRFTMSSSPSLHSLTSHSRFTFLLLLSPLFLSSLLNLSLSLHCLTSSILLNTQPCPLAPFPCLAGLPFSLHTLVSTPPFILLASTPGLSFLLQFFASFPRFHRPLTSLMFTPLIFSITLIPRLFSFAS